MTEYEKVFDAFRNCITVPKCKDCPWDSCDTLNNSPIEIPKDLALAVMRLLKDSEHRIPKKVTHTATNYKRCTCPSCGNVVDMLDVMFGQKVRIMNPYCEYCGQALDWSDEERSE